MDRRGRIVVAVVASALFMQQLDVTIVATALPKIAASLDANPVHLNVLITAYVLSTAVFMPLGGWLADRFGARNVFMGSLLMFTLGSLWCGLSTGAVEMTAARVLQGAGGAFMTPIGRLVVLRTVPKSQFVQAIAMMQIPSQVGIALGPLLGGLFATYVSWRWIFLINIPIGLVALYFAARYIDNVREADPVPLDVAGYALFSGFLVALLYGVELLARSGLAGASGWSLIVLSGVLLWLAVRHSMRHPHPLADLSLLALPSYRVNLTGGNLFRLGTDGLRFLLPLMFQTIFHFSAFLSGVLMSATAVGAITIRALAAPTFRRFGFRRVLIAGSLISAGSVVVYAMLEAGTPLVVMLAVLFAGGLLQAMVLTALNALSYADVSERQMATANTFSQLSQKSMGALGVTLASLLLQISLTARGGETPAHGDFVFAFAVGAVLCVAAVASFRTLLPHVGREVSGHDRDA